MQQDSSRAGMQFSESNECKVQSDCWGASESINQSLNPHRQIYIIEELESRSGPALYGNREAHWYSSWDFASAQIGLSARVDISLVASHNVTVYKNKRQPATRRH
jgi:hypothetical protein